MTNDVDDAVDLGSAYGLTPDAWQEDVLEGWLGLRKDGKWAASTCGLAVPRQNGKNAILEVRELHGMISLGEKFLHTAHEVKTARKAFLRLASFFENERQYPELAARVKEIRKTNGQEAIVLDNGGSCEFIARSKGSGRGYTVDVLVCDEAQELSEDSLAALLPTISAAPTGNPQQIYTGTPPAENMNGEVFGRVRKAGQTRSNQRLCWIDYGLEGPLPDVDDRALWRITNPALGGRLNLDTLLDERATMSDETFARERLGWWGDPDATGSAIPRDAWDLRRDPNSKFGTGQTGLGIHITGDRRSAFIGGAGVRPDKTKHLELLDVVGPASVVDAVLALQKRRACPVVIDPGSHAGSLIQPLREAGVQVEEITLQKITAAAGALYDGVIHGTIAHLGQPDLDQAVYTATTRETVRGAWTWKGPAVTPLVSVTLALHCLLAFGPDNYEISESVW